MTAAGRSRSFVLLARLVVAGLVVVAGVIGVGLGGVGLRAAPVRAQTTTVPVVTSAAPAPSTTAATAGDEASTRTVNRIVFVLAAFAVVLVGLAIWFWRTTKPMPRHLDGLDLMGSRRWRDADPAGRSTLLAPVHERRAEVRDVEDPEGGAEPVPVVEPVPVGAEPEPVAEPELGAEPVPVGADGPGGGADADADTDDEETPRAS